MCSLTIREISASTLRPTKSKHEKTNYIVLAALIKKLKGWQHVCSEQPHDIHLSHIPNPLTTKYAFGLCPAERPDDRIGKLVFLTMVMQE